MTNRTLNISDEDRALLTDEELAGMEEGADFDEGQAEDDAIDITADVNAVAAPAGGEQPATPAVPETVVTPPAEEGADDTPAAKQPSFQTTLPDDFDERMATIATSKDDLHAKFEEGDLTNTEYAKQLDDFNKQERYLERIRDQAEYDQRQRHFNWVNVTVRGFMGDHPEYANNAMLTSLLDQEVRKIQGATDNDTDPQILIDAHAKIAAAFPQVFSVATPTPTPTPTPPAPKPTVPTLAKTPAANIEQPGENKFEHFDRLATSDPLKYERELEKLQRSNPAEYDEYMAS